MRIAVVLGFLVAGSVWYVTAPPRGASAYRERAEQTAETLRSSVQSTRIWVRLAEEGRTLRTSAAVGFREAEDDAASAASTFASYRPPPGTHDLRSDVTEVASAVEEELAGVRIAAQAGDWSSVPAAADELPELSRRLEALISRASE